MAITEEVREHWGVEFSVVPQGLAEEEVVSFVGRVMEEADKAREERDRLASLVKLAEQTVVEADKLAESIKQQARHEAEEEAAKIRTAAEEQAKEQARRSLRKAERDVAEQSSAAVAKADQEAQEIIERARREARDIIEPVLEKVAGLEKEAKLEAEYAVRRFASKFVEEIRGAVTEATNNTLPTMDTFFRESDYSSILAEGADAQPAIGPAQGKSRASPAQKGEKE